MSGINDIGQVSTSKVEVKKTPNKILTIINTVLCFFLFFISLGLIMGSVMANDSGSHNVLIWIILIGLSMGFPVFIIASVVIFWVAFYKKAIKTWRFFSVLPWAYLSTIILVAIALFS